MIDFNKELIPNTIVEKGEKLYKTSRKLMFIGVCAIALAVLMSIIGLMISGGYFYLMFIFAAGSPYEFTIPLVMAVYLGIILGCVGIPMYYSSLQIYSLGKIAENTSKK